MEGTLNILQICNSEDGILKILSDFQELHNVDLYPGQAVQCKLILPEGMKFFQRRYKLNGEKIMYIGMVDQDY